MKKITNETTIIPSENGVATYADLARLCVTRMPKEGVGVEDMRRRIRLADAIEEADGQIMLEDADYEHLKKLVAAMQWPLISQDIINFVDSVDSASTVEAPKE